MKFILFSVGPAMDVTFSVMVRPGTEVGVSADYHVSVGDDNIANIIGMMQERKETYSGFFQRSIRLLRATRKTQSNIWDAALKGKPLTVFTERSIVNVWLDSEYASPAGLHCFKLHLGGLFNHYIKYSEECGFRLKAYLQRVSNLAKTENKVCVNKLLS